MIAWKFTAPGAIGPFSRLVWPRPRDGGPGEWVEASVHPCATGVHACRRSDLPYWIHAELWEVELEGVLTGAGHKIVAPRGRLLRRIEAWDREAMRAFSQSCADRVERYATRSTAAAEYVEDLRDDVERCLAATAGDDAARAADAAGGLGARESERQAQAAWLAHRLGLPDTPVEPD